MRITEGQLRRIIREELDLERFDAEVELLGVASEANPIRGRAMYVRLP